MKTVTHSPIFFRRAPSRAVTLVELLVATAGMVIVMGLVYKVYDATQAASIKMSRRQGAIDYGVRVMDETTALLRRALAPSNVEGLENDRAVFGPDRFTVPAFPRSASEGLYLITIRPSESEEGGVAYERFEQPVDLATGEKPVEEIVRTLGGKDLEFEPELSFRYALEATPGRKVNYVDSLEPGQWPVLVEVRIKIELEEYEGLPVELRTSVIPGRVAMRAVVPTPAPPAPVLPAEPSEEPAPAEGDEAPGRPVLPIGGDGP